ncbi:MAG: ADP compounds hydrolase NudE [Candidatus Vesicomyosocius endoextente]|uniref:ADP compounds hydrolase NudE n=1 Tax=Candidatus Vesicomyosocius endoextente TaxID=2738853 RepID=A0A853G594_9GAMM|nr:ADP compounds hydrolase NudE [Candidatus Vesicomyosocius endoextente]
MRKKPTVLNIKTIATTNFFNIEEMDIKFSNGEKRIYERLKPFENGTVLIVPMLDDETVLMIYEYSGGTDKYELVLTKGKIDDNEILIEAANRELIEEIGFGANKLTFIKEMTIAPSYQSSITYIVLAQDLYKASAQGDEPELLEVVTFRMADLENLVYNEHLTEARSIAALYMARDMINKQ